MPFPLHPITACFLWATPAIPCLAQLDKPQPSVPPVSVELTLLTRGKISGPVLDYDSEGLVIVADRKAFVVAFSEMDSGSAFRAKRALLAALRGGQPMLTAEDRFGLGLYMLSRGRNVIAANEFKASTRLDRSYGPKGKAALDRFRSEQARRPVAKLSALSDERVPSLPTEADAKGESDLCGTQLMDALLGTSGTPSTPGTPGGDVGVPESWPTLSATRRAALVGDIKAFFARRLPQGVGAGIELIETDHFLLWSDLPALERQALAQWCETMYRALCLQFQFSTEGSVFLGKCPIFCFRSKARFLNFAKRFDGHSGTGSIGYTRSIVRSGYVHVVLYRQGATPPDRDRFLSTLVHEASHAFLHRVHRPVLIPHWINEGYADWVAERVLEDRCVAGENANLLAWQYVRYDWPIAELLRSTGPIGVHQYALAHSVVAFLASTDSAALGALIRGLKERMTFAQALSAAYGGMTLEALDEGWRASIRATHEGDRPGR